jgi:hypothetical protein
MLLLMGSSVVMPEHCGMLKTDENEIHFTHYVGFLYDI